MYKLICNIRSGTWTVMLDGQEVHQAGTASEAIDWIKEKKATG